MAGAPPHRKSVDRCARTREYFAKGRGNLRPRRVPDGGPARPYFFLGSGAAAGAPFTTLSCLGFFVFFLPLSPIDCLRACSRCCNGTPSAWIRQTSYPCCASGEGRRWAWRPERCSHAHFGPASEPRQRIHVVNEGQCAGLDSRPSSRCQYGTQPRAITVTVMFCLVGRRMMRSRGWLSGSKSAVMRATSA